jgi:hypothetical protein
MGCRPDNRPRVVSLVPPRASRAAVRRSGEVLKGVASGFPGVYNRDRLDKRSFGPEDCYLLLLDRPFSDAVVGSLSGGGK